MLNCSSLRHFAFHTMIIIYRFAFIIQKHCLPSYKRAVMRVAEVLWNTCTQLVRIPWQILRNLPIQPRPQVFDWIQVWTIGRPNHCIDFFFRRIMFESILRDDRVHCRVEILRHSDAEPSLACLEITSNFLFSWKKLENKPRNRICNLVFNKKTSVFPNLFTMLYIVCLNSIW